MAETTPFYKSSSLSEFIFHLFMSTTYKDLPAIPAQLITTSKIKAYRDTDLFENRRLLCTLQKK